MKKFSELNDRTTEPLNKCRLVAVDDNTSPKNFCVRASDVEEVANQHLAEHEANTTLHVTSAEHEYLKKLIAQFPEFEPDVPWFSDAPMPEGSLSYDSITRYFMLNATDNGVTVAPGRVYISRVPWARYDATSSSWVNNAPAVDESVFTVTRKFMDNAGLKHSCSTDKILGDDDYYGKEWVFHWEQCNYACDPYGVKHVTAIRGQETNMPDNQFDPKANIGVFGPAFWYFCKTESFQKDDGTYLTHDGTADGTPLFQLWGISDRPWNQLDAGRRAELNKHGITEKDFSIWPECRVYVKDETGGHYVDRPYWCHSAYCGGYELNEAGAEIGLSSKKNVILRNNVSYQSLNALYGAAVNDIYPAQRGGLACVNGFGMLFDIVKNATKNSQSIHMGMAQNNNNAVLAAYTTKEAGYVFPIASKGNFEVGCTVRLWQTNANSQQISAKPGYVNQYGRITAIETRTITQADDTEVSSLCLVIDPDTVEPFLVRTTIGDTKALTDAGQYACCYATQGQSLAGETDLVQGYRDGSVTSLTNGRHPYRVQGTEYMPGSWIVAADVYGVVGDGSTSVTIEGVTVTPTGSQKVILIAPSGTPRHSGGNLSQSLAKGYVPIHFMENVNGGYILNERIVPTYGVAVPVAWGGTGSGSNTGHADNILNNTASACGFMVGGRLNDGVNAGSAALDLNGGVGNSDWGVVARD